MVVAAHLYTAPTPPAVLTGTVVFRNNIAANEDIGICVSKTAPTIGAGGLAFDLAATKVSTSNDCSL